ncbi:MAG: MurR/RpiR family transcriptional regulator [Alphaproteobacteria bacterium]|jgi:RpiR family glv operon transcriptional regulator|nr:MurR/RpiR family transcriptional regulator [Alphaproteobacteria bacterium]
MELPELINHLQELSPKPFKENEIKIGTYLYKCANNKHLENLTVRMCANYLKISNVSLVRFGKKLGLSGFNELKDYVDKVVHGKSPLDIDNYSQLTYALTQQSINLNISAFADLESFLTDRRKILIYGEGISNLVARYFTIQLGKIGIIIDTIDMVSSTERSIAELKNSNGVIFVSQSGETEMVLKKAKICQELNIPTVSLTTHQPNSLAGLSTVNIKIVANNDSNPKLNSINYNSVIFFMIDFFIQKLLVNKQI